MPVHDWTRVDAGIFHAFHHDWITDIARALNGGLLPSEYYALPEQIAGRLGPDVITLRVPATGVRPAVSPPRGIAVAEAPPRVRFHIQSESSQYASRAKAVAIHHTSDHRVIALVEVISPGNKNSNHGLRAFLRKAVEALQAGIHLLIVDLFPPGPRDPEGIHHAIWGHLMGESDFTQPADAPLMLASYIGGDCPEAYLQPVVVEAALPEMPLFLTPEVYILTPLEATYQSAWAGMPAYWREVLSRPTGS